jgi:hypothetical protein
VFVPENMTFDHFDVLAAEPPATRSLRDSGDVLILPATRKTSSPRQHNQVGNGKPDGVGHRGHHPGRSGSLAGSCLESGLVHALQEAGPV